MGHDIPWTTIRKFLDNANNGNMMKVRKNAIVKFESIVSKMAKEIAEKAVILMNHSNRSTLFTKDIETAASLLLEDIVKWKTF